MEVLRAEGVKEAEPWEKLRFEERHNMYISRGGCTGSRATMTRASGLVLDSLGWRLPKEQIIAIRRRRIPAKTQYTKKKEKEVSSQLAEPFQSVGAHCT